MAESSLRTESSTNGSFGSSSPLSAITGRMSSASTSRLSVPLTQATNACASASLSTSSSLWAVEWPSKVTEGGGICAAQTHR